jgi:hypothetical protein
MNEQENILEVKYLFATLQEKYDLDPDEFKNALKESNALIAGGAILSSIHKEPINDTDIYVNISRKNAILSYLNAEGFVIKKNNVAPAYDQSFFKKNHIFARILYSKDDNYVDIMLVEDSTPVRQVVQNFDLSFCEVWYDPSTDRLAGNLEQAVDKEGILNPEYEAALLQYFNPFIIKRMQKYTKRGYTITYECSGTQTVKIPKKRLNDTDEDEEEWVAKSLYKSLNTSYILKTGDNNNFILNYPLTSYTVAEVVNIMNRLLSEGIFTGSINSLWSRTWKDAFEFVEKNPKLTVQYDRALTKFKNYIPPEPIPEKFTDKTCKDLLMFDDNIIGKYLQENPNNIIFVMSDDVIFCYDKNYIYELSTDPDNIFYECTGRLFEDGTGRAIQYDVNKPYVKIPGSFEGLNILISKKELYDIWRYMPSQIYNLEYTETFTHTISNQAITNNNFVSANHCQAGSNYLVYSVQPYSNSDEGGAAESKI